MERSQEFPSQSHSDKLSEKNEIESPSFKESLGKLIDNSTDILKSENIHRQQAWQVLNLLLANKP